jgi:hypothetical protein
MTENSLPLAEIVSWYRVKQRSLQSTGVSLVDIRERTEYVAAATADFDAVNAMGRISGWVPGEFDFEVVRSSDGKDLFWRHVKTSVVDGLESTYADLLHHLLEPGGPR